MYVVQQTLFIYFFVYFFGGGAEKDCSNQQIHLVVLHNKERIEKMWIKESFLHIQRYFFTPSPTHWANPTSC